MITLYGSATSPNVLKVRNMMQAGRRGESHAGISCYQCQWYPAGNR